MELVDLNYLPPSVRVAVFMSAAPGRPPPRPVVYRGARLSKNAVPQQIVIAVAH